MKAIAKYAIFAALLGDWIAFTPQVHAQGGVPLWTNYYHGPKYGADGARAIAVDSNGNVFVTGASAGTNGFIYNDYYDYATVAYSSAGVALWTNRYNEPASHLSAYGVAVSADSSGNVFVAGTSTDTHFFHYIATLGYSSAGLPLWTNVFDDGGDDNAVAMATDSSGGVFVTGYSGANSAYEAYVTLAYSGAGLPLWTNGYNGGNDDDRATGMAVDGSGKIFVTGKSYGTTVDATIAYSGSGVPLWTNRYAAAFAIAVDKGSGNVFVAGALASASGYNYRTTAFSGTGVPLWTNLYDQGGAGAIAVDKGSGNVLVTGGSTGSGGYYDYGTVAYSSAGVPLWTNRYHGPAGGESDVPTAIAVDSAGNVFVTGGSSISTNSTSDFVTVAYSRFGAPLWTNRYHWPGWSGGHSQATAIAVDGSGNVFVTGCSPSESNSDYATIKYSSSLQTYLAIQRIGNQLVLSWTNPVFNLQSATAVNGPFTNIPGATSQYTNSISGSRQYFRLAAP